MRMKILVQESISPYIQRKRKNKKEYTKEIATTSKKPGLAMTTKSSFSLDGRR